MAQQSTTVHTDSGTAGEDEQPPSVTFIDSQSYDIDEITVDTNQAEGLDTVPSCKSSRMQREAAPLLVVFVTGLC